MYQGQFVKYFLILSFLLSSSCVLLPSPDFIVIGPEGVHTQSTVTVQWQGLSSAFYYDVILGINANCSNAAVVYSQVTSTSVVAGPLADGTYALCISAVLESEKRVPAGNSGLTFTIDTTGPDAFAFIAPLNGVAVTHPTLSWQAATDANAYRVILANDALCSQVVEEYYPITATSVATAAALPDGVYYLCGTAYDLYGNDTEATNSGAFSFYVDTTPPDVFTIDSLPAFTNQTQPTLSWSVSTGAFEYRLTLSSTSASGTCTGTPVVTVNLPPTTQQFPLLTALTDGTYYVCVSALDSGGNAVPASNNALSFVVDTVVPGAFHITDPTGNTGLAMPQVRWADAADAGSGVSHYAVAVSRSVDAQNRCLNPVASAPLISGTSFWVTPALTMEGIYFVCVEAVDRAGNRRWATNTGTHQFTLDLTPPSAFQILTPTPNQVFSTYPPSVLVTWTHPGDADFARFDLNVSKTGGSCSYTPLNQTNVTSPLTLTQLPDCTYQLTVVARDQVGNQTLRSVSFTVGALPAGVLSFAVTAPALQSYVPVKTPTLQWTRATAPTAVYDLRLDQEANCPASITSQSGITCAAAPCTWTVGQDLLDGTYFVCAQSRDIAGNTQLASNSGTHSFIVDAVPPEEFLITGPNPSVLNTARPTFSWTSSVGAMTYRLQLATSTGSCSAPVRSISGLTLTTYTLSDAEALPEGVYKVCVTAIDTFGQTPANNSDTFTLTIDLTRPAIPILSSTSPISGSDQNSPKVIGSAEAGSLVTLYRASGCTSLMTQGSAAQLANPGITISVTDNSTTTIYATATDVAGNVSFCTPTPLVYEERSQYWVWLGPGTSQSPNQGGTYGPHGAFSVSFSPGARQGMTTWKTVDGSVWVFGGEGYDANYQPGYLNDLWKYDVAAGGWGLVRGSHLRNQPGTYGTQGTPSAANTPGARTGAMGWVDAFGHLWLFGGEAVPAQGGQPAKYFSDVWKFDVFANQWIWISGPTTLDTFDGTGQSPTPRSHAQVWSSGTSVWIYGGRGNDTFGQSGLLSDMWKFTSGTWQQVFGTSVANQAGVFTNFGVESTTARPGGRTAAGTWVGSTATQLWFVGGNGVSGVNQFGNRNDVWKFNTVNNRWTWVRGSSSIDVAGDYGTRGVPAATNTPGARKGAAVWKDGAGVVWLFGGGVTNILNGPGAPDVMNDLWKFSMSTLEWTWVAGSPQVNQLGVYGAVNQQGTLYYPGGRDGAAAWWIASNKIYVFGGYGLGVHQPVGLLNDFWKFIP